MAEDFKDIFGDWDPKDGEQPSDGPTNDRRLDLKEVSVVGVFDMNDPNAPGESPQTFVLLQDRRERKVPIWIGRFEAFAISTALENEQLDRPMTHDLIRLLIERLGATVDHAVVDDLWQETFYAKLIVTHAERTQEIDCRPSDAIAVAVRTKSPIYVAESVFEAVTPST